jgi:Ca2+-binding RTX toxin-like protein
MPAIDGTSGDDSIAGTFGDDTINVFDGNDTVFASSGSDTVSGGAGNDRLDGGDGNDTINGDDGDDVIFGGLGNDIVDGGAGNDTLVVRNNLYDSDLYSGDQFIGGVGTDTIVFNGDFTYGFTAFDITSIAISGIEIIHADLPVRLTFNQFTQFQQTTGIFEITGSGTLDLTGGSFLRGTLRLGTGNDLVTLSGTFGTGFRSVEAGAGDDQITGGETGESLSGGDGDDQIDGGAGADSISGGAGNDTIHGGDGNDTIWDGAGIDFMVGGAGDDLFQLDLRAGFGPGETVIGGAGIDTVWLNGLPGDTSWYDLSALGIGSDIERLDAPWVRMSMSTSQANQFQSLELAGLRLTTGGNITLGSNFEVSLLELSNSGNGVDASVVSGLIGVRATGGAGNDTVIGTSSNDVISGGAGDDVIHGGLSHDQLTGGEGIDRLDGGGGDDWLIVQDGETVSAGDRFSGGAGNDTLYLRHTGSGTITDISAALIDTDIEGLDSSVGIRLTVAQADQFTSIRAGGIYLADAGSLDLTNVAFSGFTIYLSDFGNQGHRLEPPV